ncbi:MAG: hypothetical protein WBD40_03710, partial [Tepidisphaeraceae bacterium]
MAWASRPSAAAEPLRGRARTRRPSHELLTHVARHVLKALPCAFASEGAATATADAPAATSLATLLTR